MNDPRPARPAAESPETSLRIKVEKTLRHYQWKASRALRGLARGPRPLPADRPIFVVGCSCGGTTLVYRTFKDKWRASPNAARGESVMPGIAGTAARLGY